ncbi:uncharacterized protein KNAG_0K02530 [Huiozyma naganishii CBS 8797]|uniref:Serine aminopeptidase S33 domain-containing protein n=1 Tax=Huiozyma naganishii (strain ATCC MYA-139 / BCRC 22969 / CBS 8797 / KCTC 17520 / NBRC 10181 / NCYC 3082 / Yp74L-3) TaxID=1071383 RepID=J7SB02_HUIN7|nr:hypothetical protein KNAG_0K02530 [Kazachstania naganishii CBS 8797]CCK72616.1 hypothetical protein KNAG_0K02530 [Kazachstania naganishii CBS 8797]
MWLKYARIIFGGLLALSTVSMSALYLFQNRLVYPSWAQDARKHVDTPDIRNIPYDRVRLITKDGVKIDAFDVKNPNSKTTIVILCPNAGNIGYFIPIIELFYRQFGLSVFIYSYRGYGLSEGSPSEAGLKMDADRAISYLATNEFHKKRKLVLYGRSLGGANAIYIASKYPSLIDGVILENTFLSITKVIPYMFPILSKFAFMCHELWKSEDVISQCSPSSPFLFLSGLRDEIVPPSHMKKLFELCTSTAKRIFEFPTGHHNDTILQDGYWEIIRDFLDQYNFI